MRIKLSTAFALGSPILGTQKGYTIRLNRLGNSVVTTTLPSVPHLSGLPLFQVYVLCDLMEGSMWPSFLEIGKTAHLMVREREMEESQEGC